MKEKAISLLEMGANKKKKLSEESGNVLLLKDLSNISCNAWKGNSRNDLDATVQSLMH